MTDAFEKWIKGMDDLMYAEWIEEEATEAQEEKALNIRTPIDSGEDIIVEDAQAGNTNIGYKEEELEPEKSRATNDTVIQPQQAPVRIQSRSPILITPVKYISANIQKRVTPPTGQAPVTRPAYQPAQQQPPRQSFTQRATSFIKRLNPFRRNK